MNPNQQIVEFRDFSGGLSLENPVSLEDNEFSILENAVITNKNTIIPRPAYTAIFDPEITVSTLVGVYQFPGNEHGLSFFFPQGIYDEDGNLLLAKYGSYGTNPDTLEDLYFLTYADRVYLVGSDYSEVVEVAYTGPNDDDYTYTEIDGDVRSVASIFKDRMFFTRPDTPDRLHYTDIGDMSTLDSYIDVEGADPSGISAIIPFNDVLFIFKESSIWTLYANGETSNWTLRLSDSSRGAISRNSVFVQSNILYFIDKYGLTKTDGVGYTSVLPQITQRILDRSNSGLTVGGIYPYRNNLCVNLRSLSDAEGIYYVDVEQETCSLWTGIPSDTEFFIDGSTHYFIKDNVVLTLDETKSQDNFDLVTNEDYYIRFKTKFHDFGSLNEMKRVFYSFCEVNCTEFEYFFHADVDKELLLGVSEDYTTVDTGDVSDGLSRFYKLNCPNTFRRVALDVRINANINIVSELNPIARVEFNGFGFVIRPRSQHIGDDT